MRQPLVAGNWKMNGSRESIKILLDGLKAGQAEVKVAEIAVCAPAVYISDTQNQLQGTPVVWGGQDLSAETSGAYTGEIAASMLLDFGCKYVIIGHSERRAYHGESDELVAKKYATARTAGWCQYSVLVRRWKSASRGLPKRLLLVNWMRSLNVRVPLRWLMA